MSPLFLTPNQALKWAKEHIKWPPIEPISDEQLAEIERLCAIEAFKDGADSGIEMGELRGLIARLRAAEADAKRYRWLRDPERMPADDPHGHLIVGEADGEDIHWRESLDNAIDRAMERTP